jgi:glycosyltransferase involved in cell wall biosynthesis
MSPALRTFQIGMSGSASGGGLERYYFELMRALREIGVGASGVVVGNADGGCDGAPDVSTFAGPRDSMLTRWSHMRALAPARIAAADVVVSHFAPYIFPVLDRIGKRPFVVHFHGPWALESRANGEGAPQQLLRSLIERAVYGAGTRFITLSHAFAAILTRRYGIREDRIAVVRGGVDLRRFRARVTRAEARERLGWPQDRRTIVTVRRLVASKGLEGLIDAVDRVRRVDPDVLVNILGTGPLAADLQRRIDDHDLGRNVRLAGRITDDDLILAYRAADCSIVPSVAYEGFGLVVVESLACGTPALVTNVGGLPETIRDFDPSLVIDGANAASIADALARVVSGVQRLPTEAACLAHAERFDWPAVAADVRDVYAGASR